MVRWLVEQQHLVVTHVGYTRRLIRGGGTWWLRACGSCSRILPKPIRIFHPPEKESTGSEASDGAKPMDESTWGGEVRARSGGGQGEIRGRSGRDQGEVRARSGRGQGEIRGRSGRGQGEVRARSGRGQAGVHLVDTALDGGCARRLQPILQPRHLVERPLHLLRLESSLPRQRDLACRVGRLQLRDLDEY